MNLPEDFEPPTLEPFRAAKLSSTEWQIAKLAALGYTDEEMARVAKVSRNTVQVHIQNIYRKCDLQGWGNPRVRLALAMRKQRRRG